MHKVINLYMDDTGTRHPDHAVGREPAHKHDWFALGGYMVAEADEPTVRKMHAQFCASWEIESPLRSADIRAKVDGFRWLRAKGKEEQQRFYEELYQLMAQAPVIGIACTIDRPGYNHRYREKYGRNRWQLCKTAFSIAVERAAKYARSQDAKLRVHVEKGDKKTDAMVKSYYEGLKQTGMPFSGDSSGKYAPLTIEELKNTLFEFRTKAKSSPMAQLADLYAWPMAIGGYDRSNRPYVRLLSDKKIIDAFFSADEIPHLGCKYSCFDLVHEKAQKNENPDCSGSSAATVG